MKMTTEVRTVKMPCGGDLSFHLNNANPLAWPVADRNFFFALVDALNAYEEHAKARNQIERDRRNAVAAAMLTDLRKRLESPHSVGVGDPPSMVAASESQGEWVRSSPVAAHVAVGTSPLVPLPDAAATEQPRCKREDPVDRRG